MQSDLLEHQPNQAQNASSTINLTVDSGTYVTFDLSGQTFGVEVRHVREILDHVNVNQLPNTPHEVEGVVDIRGETVPIINLGSKLGLQRSDDSDDTRVIIFEIAQDAKVCPIGVLADSVRDVTRIAADEVERTPEIVGAVWERRLMLGIARRAGHMIVLLNIEQVILGSYVSIDFDQNLF